jgi:hypothetical protein
MDTTLPVVMHAPYAAEVVAWLLKDPFLYMHIPGSAVDK